MLKKSLQGWLGGKQAIGILSDGTLFVDAHVFDNDDYGDYADTDFLPAADVVRLKEMLGARGLKAATNEQLLDVLAALYSTAYDTRMALKALGFQPMHRTDLGARYDVPNVMPPAVH